MGNAETRPEYYIQPEEDLLFKIVTIGDSGVGKTSLYLRYVDNRMEAIKTTLKCEFMIKLIKVDDKVIKLRLWDTFGQERFRSVTRSYYRGSHGLLVVFDLTNMASFQNIHTWIEGCDELISGDSEITKVLVGNKSDLEEKRQVPYETAKKVADELGIAYIETSALTDTNVSDVFVTMATTLKQRVDDGTLQGTESGPVRITKRSHEISDHVEGPSCSC